MTIIDRYLLKLFIKILAICFFSFTGLFIIIDAFGNLDEFIAYGEQQNGILRVMCDYYGARVLSFFDRTSAVLTLVAAIFAITWMQRNNELTALMAAGINLRRVVKPLVLAVIVVSVLALANREFLIPSVRDKLSRNAQNWLGDTKQPLRPQFDHKTDILIGGQHTVVAERKIENPTFRCFTNYGSFGRQLVAETAVFLPRTNERPSGYLLNRVEVPEDLQLHSSSFIQTKEQREPVIFSPSDTTWLEKDQLFVVSEVDFDHLANGSSLKQYSSSMDLMRGLRNSSLDYGADVRVTIHARFLQPLLDATLLFLGIPLVLTRENRNMFVAAGMCVSVVAVFFVVVLACHALGASGIINPALAAWLPLIIFVPIAYGLAAPLRNVKVNEGQEATR